MAEPEIAALKPILLTLQPGTYWWCRCGRSKNQPWCDGSHAGTEFEPMKVELEQEERIAFCQCKRTEGAPVCDGSHKQYKEIAPE